MTNETLPSDTLRPTRAELVILRVLWASGPATVRQVHEAMPGDNASGYTTILKLLQIMHRKKLVVRDDSQRAHIYKPVFSKEQVQEQLTSDLIQRAFDGSPSQLVLQALGGSRNASQEDLKAIRSLLNELEGQRQPTEESI
jgi:predicted transcriptional regulator